MGHDIARNDTVVSTTREWHRKEHLIEAGLPPREGVRRALPWETELIPVFGQLFHKGFNVPIAAPDHRLHLRTDDRTVLGVVGKDYKPVPNRVLGDFAEALAGADASVKVETCGSLRGGKRVFLCAKTDSMLVSGEDALNTYLTLTNCHDGTGAFRVYFCTVRIVCANTFRFSESRIGNAGFWFRHDGDVQAKVEEARRVLGLAHKVQSDIRNDVRAMSASPVSQTVVDAYFAQVYEATFGARPAADREQVAIATSDQVDDLLDSLNSNIEIWETKRAQVLAQWAENHENDPGRGTAWGAFNAITEFHDHQRGRGKPQERTLTDARMHSNLFGASAQDKQKAHAIAQSLLIA
jgi:phage/plasmid-like protein (TIGR03299 family)